MRIVKLKSGKSGKSGRNAARRRSVAVVLEVHPGRALSISIPSVTSGNSVALPAVSALANGPQVYSTTFVCLPEDEDRKPCGLVNMSRIGYGSGSCWINAGLQFLFGSERLQACLRDHFITYRDRFCRRGPDALQSPWSLVCDAGPLNDNFRRIRRKFDAESQTNLFDGLSLTFMAMMQGRDSSGSSLVGRDFVPHIQVSTFRLY